MRELPFKINTRQLEYSKIKKIQDELRKWTRGDTIIVAEVDHVQRVQPQERVIDMTLDPAVPQAKNPQMWHRFG